MNRQMIGAIDVGSNALRMKIAEIDEDGYIKEVEQIRKAINLGHDCFNEGRVCQETINKTCGILQSFKELLEMYHVDLYGVKATSAVREAANRAYFIEQVRLRSGIEIDYIDNAKEQLLTLKAVRGKVSNFEELIQEGVIVIVVGAGNIQITIYDEGELVSSQRVKLGALRIKEILSHLEKETVKYYKLLEEYITVHLEGLDFNKYCERCQHFIAVGGELGIVENILYKGETRSDDVGILSASKFEQLYKRVKVLSPDEIVKIYDVNPERANIMVPSMMLFEKLLSAGGFDKIITPNISLVDGMFIDMYERKIAKKSKTSGDRDSLACARVVAEKFVYNEEHSHFVEEIALKLFDETRDYHGLVRAERLLLQLAAILHDVGKYVGLDQHSYHSYNLVRALEIIGVTEREMTLVANICMYHGVHEPDQHNGNYQRLSVADQVVVAKLVSFIKIADALDRSHNQKIHNITIKLKNNTLIIKGNTQKNVKLEEWTFKMQGHYIEQIMGIETKLKISKEI